MKYFVALLLVINCTALNAVALNLRFSADTNHAAADTNHPKADTDTIIRKQSLSTGVTYGSDAIFFGRTGPVKYPFVSVDAIYNAKNGLFLYGSGLKVLGYNPFFDELDLGGGYLYKPTKAFTGSISYTRFIFNSNAHIIKSASSNDLNFNNSYDFGLVKPAVTFDYLFGVSHDYFITLGLSKYIESSFSVFDDKDYITIKPNVSLILGTQNFVQRYSLDHQYRQDADQIFINSPDEPQMAHRNGQFNALDYYFKLPIAYNRPHYTLEFTYKYSIPVNVEGALMNSKESFYNLTFYYVFY